MLLKNETVLLNERSALLGGSVKRQNKERPVQRVTQICDTTFPRRKNSPQDIFSIIRNNLGDPAYHVSFSALRSH